MNHRCSGFLTVLVVLGTILSFAGAAQAAPPSAEPIEVAKVTFAHGLTEEMVPVDPDPTATFQPNETVYLSVQVKGRPKAGVLSAKFYWDGSFIADASIDMADLNSGVLFSFGEDTYAGYQLTHDDVFPVGEKYYAGLYYEGELLDTYPFRVAAPPGSVASQVKSVTLARGADADYLPVGPTDTFTTDEKVFAVIAADLGIGSWMRSTWNVNGQVDEDGSVRITAPSDALDTGLYFSFLPKGGWPVGDQSLVLTLDDAEIGRYTFAIAEPFFDKLAFLDTFPLPDQAEIVETADDYDTGFTSPMTETELLQAYDEWLQGEGWTRQAPAEPATAAPSATWRTQGAELLLEVQGTTDQGLTEAWVKITKLEPYMKEAPTGLFSGSSATKK